MITSLDIDETLATQVEAAAKARGMTSREFIRAALRQAVSLPSPSGLPARFVQRTHDFGTHLETPWTILADLETDDHVRFLTKK